MNVGTLEIQLMADMAQLKRDMEEAKGTVGSAMKDIESVIGVVKTAFVGLAGAASVQAFAGMINGAIESAGALNDLSIATGASVESLSRFSEVGRTTNTSGEAIAGMMNKLSKATVEAKDGTHGAGAAVTALGLNFNDFQKLEADEKLRTLAVAMNGFQDGSEKSAVAMELLGKSGATALPFLKDLAEQGDVVARVTAAQAKASDDYSDNLTILRASGEAWKTELAMGMVPAMNTAVQAFISVSNESGGLREEVRKLSADGSIAGWTTSTINGITYVMDVFSGLKAVVNSVGEVIGAWIASVGSNFTGLFESIGKAMKGDFSGAADAMNATITRQKSILVDLGDTLDKTWGEKTLGARLRERMADIRSVGEVTEATKPKLDTSAIHNGNAEAAKKQMDAYRSLSASIEAKIATAQRDLDTTGKMTDAGKILDKLNADLAAGTVVLTAKQLADTQAKIAHLDAMQRHIDLQKEEKKLQDDIAKDADGILQELYKRTEALGKDNEKLREHNEAIGLDARALVALTQARLLDRADLLDSTAATKDDTGNLLANSGELKEQARLLRERAGLLGEGIIAKEAAAAKSAWEDTTKAIGDGLSSALYGAVRNGKDIWLTFRDYLVATIIDGTIKNAFGSVITNGLNSMISSLTGVRLGGTAAPGGGSLITTALDAGVNKITGGTGGVSGALSSAGSSIASALGFTGSAAGASSAAAGSAAAVNGGIASGTAAFDAALASSGAGAGATAGGSAAASSSAAAGSGSFLAVAGPIAAAIATFAIMNSMNDKDGLNYWNTYDASGKGGSGPVDGPIAIRNRFAMNRPTMDALAQSYVSTANSLKITPEAGSFGFDSAADGTFNMGATFDGGHYRSGWVPNNADTMEWAKARALFTALQASEKPKSIAGFFDGVDAGLLPLADIQERLAQAAAAPKFALGGDHLGGLRIVGENGPELEATGPARIFNANETASMLRSGGASGDELLSEMRAVRRALAAMAVDMRRTADATNGGGDGPMQVEVTA